MLAKWKSLSSRDKISWQINLSFKMLVYALETSKANVIIFICEIEMYFSNIGVGECSHHLTSVLHCACQKILFSHCSSDTLSYKITCSAFLNVLKPLVTSHMLIKTNYNWIWWKQIKQRERVCAYSAYVSCVCYVCLQGNSQRRKQWDRWWVRQWWHRGWRCWDSWPLLLL